MYATWRGTGQCVLVTIVSPTTRCEFDSILSKRFPQRMEIAYILPANGLSSILFDTPAELLLCRGVEKTLNAGLLFSNSARSRGWNLGPEIDLSPTVVGGTMCHGIHVKLNHELTLVPTRTLWPQYRHSQTPSLRSNRHSVSVGARSVSLGKNNTVKLSNPELSCARLRRPSGAPVHGSTPIHQQRIRWKWEGCFCITSKRFHGFFFRRLQ